MVDGNNIECIQKLSFSKSIKPLTAFVAGMRLLKDIEDTKQAFIIFDAIDGPQTERNFSRFQSLETGQKLIEENIDYTPLLLDRGYLSTLPSNSVAAAYLNFTNVEGLDAEHLSVAERDANISTLNLDAARRCFVASGFALHDIMHVITGYGRDPIGEACVIAFTAAQLDLKGLGLIARAVCFKEQLRRPDLAIMAAHTEAVRIARDANWLHGIDWRPIFHEPLDDARQRLGIARPKIYQRLAIGKTEGSAADGGNEVAARQAA